MNVLHRVIQQQHFVPSRRQLLNEDALLEVFNRLTDVGEEEDLVLALFPLLEVRIQADILTLVRVETNERRNFILRRFVLCLDSTKLGDAVVGFANYVELFWVLLECPLEQLDKSLDKDALKLLEELSRLERLTRNIERKVIG